VCVCVSVWYCDETPFKILCTLIVCFLGLNIIYSNLEILNHCYVWNKSINNYYSIHYYNM